MQTSNNARETPGRLNDYWNGITFKLLKVYKKVNYKNQFIKKILDDNLLVFARIS